LVLINDLAKVGNLFFIIFYYKVNKKEGSEKMTDFCDFIIKKYLSMHLQNIQCMVLFNNFISYSTFVFKGTGQGQFCYVID